MKKKKILSLLLATVTAAGLFTASMIPASADDNDAGNGMVISKTAVAVEGGFEITLEAYAIGSKITSTVNKDVPTDIVLVIDQSSSMEYCIGCGKEIKKNSKHSKDTYTVTYSVNTSSTYYVKDGNNYIQVSYCSGSHGNGWGGTQCSGGAGWYKYARDTKASDHTADAKYTPKTSATSEGEQFYIKSTTYEKCSSRLSALKTAVTTFVDSVNTKAKGADKKYGTDDDVNHRIAVVGFATGDYSEIESYPEYENTELFIGSTQYNYYNTDVRGYYASALQNMNTEAGYNNVIASKNALDAKGATHVDLGIKMANGIFDANKIDTNEKRNRVMIVFTDGSPSAWAEYSETVANDAIKKAYDTKNTYNATVYTVGVFENANGSTPSNLDGLSNDNKFMHLTSSNYLRATSMANTGNVNPDLKDGDTYFLDAGDSDSLNNIFQQIADKIENGGSSTTLGSDTVIKDIIAPQFELPEGTKVSDITIETYRYNGPDVAEVWSNNNDNMGATASIDGDKVNVTGFDFSTNWCGTETTNGTTTYRGNKLVIKFTVQTKAGFLGGNDVYTNTSAGVYENADATEPVQTFPSPTVNVPIQDVTVTATDKNVYLLGELTAEHIKEGATVKCGDVVLKLDQENYGLQSWQTEYVNITVTYTDARGNTITDLNDLKDDTTYTVSATVSPKTDGSSTDQGTVAETISGNVNGKINVFKPELTFKDSEVYYGDTAPASYDGNKTSEVWKHGETVSTAVTMIGDKPTLDLTYVPEAEKIVDGKINTKQDIPVDVTVKIGDNDVTDKTTFVHTKCNTSEADPANGKFWLHVKTCSLTITKAAGANTTIGNDEYFVFNVKKDGTDYTQVTIQGTGSVELKELPVGDYTITEDASTAWRYNSTISGSGNLSSTNTDATLTCTNTKSNEHWLNHFARVINTFGKAN